MAAELDRTLSDSDVVLISKDINLRMKALALGLSAEDYETDKAPRPDELYTGCAILENSSPDLISRFYEQPFAVPVEEVPGIGAPRPNQFFILKNGSVSALAYVDSSVQFLHRVQKRRAYGIDPRNAGQAFAMHALLDPEIPLVTLTGKAGTGKTLLALAAALETTKRYRQIYLARPVVPLSNRDMGFLPGDIASKLDPYMQPLWDNLGVIKGSFAPDSMEADRIDDMLESDRSGSHPWPTSGQKPEQGLLHRGRGAESHAPRSEDHHHKGRRGHQIRIHRGFQQIDTPTWTAAPTASPASWRG